MKPEILLVGPPMPRVPEALAGHYVLHHLRDQAERTALPPDVAERIRGLATHGHIGAGTLLIDALPSLEIIACYGVGVDGIDLARARSRGIVVTNTPEILTEDVASLAVGLLLAVTRRICSGDRFVRDGRWLHEPMELTTSIGGKRLGIVGLGRIGQAVARRAVAFGMSVAYTGPSRKPEAGYLFYDDLEMLARESDALVICCPGGEATRNLIGRDVLTALGPEGVLVNVSRGSIVDEGALVEALHLGRIAGAGLDVFANEPRVPEALLSMENVVLSPHMGSATRETRNAMGDLVVQNLRAHFSGTPVVTPVS